MARRSQGLLWNAGKDGNGEMDEWMDEWMDSQAQGCGFSEAGEEKITSPEER